MTSSAWLRTRILASAALFMLFALSCGGGGGSSTDTRNASLANPVNQDICNCTPSETPIEDYRHDAKHVGLSGPTGTEITVSDMLSWQVGTDPGPTAPRTGRETQMFFIAHAYAQFANIVGVDCDIHVEIAESADKNAPRVIVETPVDPEYCDARRALKNALLAHGFTLSTNSGEIDPPIPVSVLGLAFQDFEHSRGTDLVKTTWELHPAIVTVLPQ